MTATVHKSIKLNWFSKFPEIPAEN